MKHSKGFTLIEVSIVLVIIGLIIGGIILGTTLIQTSEIRSTIGQVEKYMTAAAAFRLKYGALPGDMPPTATSEFGFFTFTGVNAGISGYGDSNGKVENPSFATKEGLVFWRHLSEASLIDGNYGVHGNSAIVTTTGAVTNTVTDVARSLPPAKIGRGNYFSVGYGSAVMAGSNFATYLYLFGVTSITTVAAVTADTLTPIEAYNIDVKMDDGKPNGGRVRGASSWAASSTLNSCLMGGSAAGADIFTSYNTVADTGGSAPACQMQFKLY